MIKDVIGKPYDIDSNPPYTFNCWTLITHLIPNAPNYTDKSLLSIARQFKKQEAIFKIKGVWVEVSEFIDNDIILFAQKNTFTHAGIYLKNDRILHAKNQAGVVIEPIRILKMSFRKVKGYRWLSSK